jgi:hypothetical protein
MPTFLVIEKHTAADCPVNNEKTRKITIESASKLDELAKKHGVKSVGSWTIHLEHLRVYVCEAPSFEAFQEFLREPAISSWTNYATSEVKAALTLEETMQLIKQAK